ncbi:hypothetical protein Tco_0439427 [Tanacetum coccineum]
MLSKFVTSNTASTSGTLPSNTVTNPKEDLKCITTRSGVAYKGPTIPITSSPKVMEHKTEVTKDTMLPTKNGSTEDVQPPVVPVVHHESISEPINAPVSASMPNQKASIPFPSRRNDERRREKANDQIEKFYKIFRDLSFEITLYKSPLHSSDQTSRYTANYNHKTVNRIDVIDRALLKKYSQEVLGFSNVISEWGHSSLESKSLIVIPSPPPNQGNYLLEIIKDLKICEANSEKSSVNEPPKVELKDLPPHLEYAFLEGNDKLPVIIAKDLKNEEKAAPIKVLKSHKRVIAWKLSDIKGINPEFCTHKILMEEDYEPTVQHQRRVNPKIHDVIKKEVEKLLDAGLIYPIFDSPWVSPVHCVPKKGGMIVVKNEENDLIPTRLVTGWRVCIDYRKLNEATRKDHFPLPFMDQMLERLAGNQY